METGQHRPASSGSSSRIQDHYRTNVSVSLKEFAQGIERAADFLRSQRAKRQRQQKTKQEARFNMDDDTKSVWSGMMRQFVGHTKMIVDFSKVIPGFNRLGLNDRRQLIRAAMYPIMLIELSRDYQEDGPCTFNYFDFSEIERDVILRKFEPLRTIATHLSQSGKVLQDLNLDDTERTLICIQELLRHKNDLEDSASCEHLFLLSMQAIVNHEQSMLDSEKASERLTTFTQLLPMLNRLNVEHHEVLGRIRDSNPGLTFPELYVEMFAIGADDPPPFFKPEEDDSSSSLM